jgi:hypothetical protein
MELIRGPAAPPGAWGSRPTYLHLERTLVRARGVKRGTSQQPSTPAQLSDLLVCVSHLFSVLLVTCSRRVRTRKRHPPRRALALTFRPRRTSHDEQRQALARVSIAVRALGPNRANETPHRGPARGTWSHARARTHRHRHMRMHAAHTHTSRRQSAAAHAPPTPTMHTAPSKPPSLARAPCAHRSSLPASASSSSRRSCAPA